MTPKLAEYHQWMTRYDGLVRSVMAGRGSPTALGEAIDALQRALAALENPSTLEERQVLVRALVDYSNMFTGSIEGPEADARHKLNARERAFAEAQQLAADDPVRAEAAVRLGIALLGSDVQRSERLIRDALRVLDATPGASQPWLINARENLGIALLRQERWDDAEKVLDEARRAWLAGVPDAPPDQPTGSLFFNIGLARQRLGRWAEARDVLREAIERNVGQFGNDHPNTIEAQLHYAMSLVETGDKANAKPILERVADIVRSAAGEGHSFYKRAIEYLARTER